MNRASTIFAATCLLLALVAAPGTAVAQDDTGNVLDLLLPTDSTELQLQGSTAIAFDDQQRNGGSVLANYGWFITERQQVGGAVVININDDSGDIDLSGYGGPYYRYNILTGKVAPYVGASLAASFGDYLGGVEVPEGVDVEGPGDVLAEFEVGSRWFLQRNVSFNVAGSLLYDIENSDLSDVLNVRFGFSYFWD